jgi:DNA-binding transcriptional MerR regulator
MKLLKMKDLEAATGVSREAIRFYIREGLLPEPQRAGRNVAWYDESFVERIALIRRLQTERFLPLAIIKAIVRGDETPPAAELHTLEQIEQGLSVRGRSKVKTRLPERLEALSARTGIGAEEIRDFDRIGAIAIEHRDGAEWLDALSIEVIEGWSVLRTNGYTAERGFDTNIIEIYAQMVQWMAREEIRMFTGRVTGKVRGEELTQMAEVGIEAVAGMIAAMREATIRRYIAEGNIPREARPKRSGSTH